MTSAAKMPINSAADCTITYRAGFVSEFDALFIIIIPYMEAISTAARSFVSAPSFEKNLFIKNHRPLS